MPLLGRLLGAPLLLRRLVKASERQAQALEDLRDHICWGGAKRNPDASDDGVDISYSTDHDTFKRELDERSAPWRRPGARGDE